MTARMRLDRRMWWLGSAMYAGFGLFLSGMLGGWLLGQPPVLALPGFALGFMVSMATHFFLLRCPKCRGNLAPVAMRQGWLSVDRRVCFCPYCGVCLDEELPVEAIRTDR
jgi:hypothetical protein